MTGEAINAASLAFKRALIEASLNAELTPHLGYAPDAEESAAEKPEAASNQRNGPTSKTVLTGDGALRIATPRDRDGSFQPVLLPKHARRFTAFGDCTVALYARGLTVREIEGYLAQAYGTEVGHDLICTVTEGVLAEVSAWQARHPTQDRADIDDQAVSGRAHRRQHRAGGADHADHIGVEQKLRLVGTKVLRYTSGPGAT